VPRWSSIIAETFCDVRVIFKAAFVAVLQQEPRDVQLKVSQPSVPAWRGW
jgi:hypothetical protein